MKKLLFFGMVLVAIASVGINISSAHAQEITPAQAAALEQQLAVMKATVINLQLQEGIMPSPEAPGTATAAATPQAVVSAPAPVSVTLSAANVASLNGALTSLAGVLVSLQTNIANDPQFLATNGPTVVATLGKIGSALALVSDSLTPSAAITPTAPIAIASGNSAGSAATTPASPTPVAVTQPVQITPVTAPAGTPAVAAPQTAQVGSTSSGFFASLNWPLIVVIVLALVAIGLWLWWPNEEDNSAAKTAKKSTLIAPVVSSRTVTVVQGPSVILTSSSSIPQTAQKQTTPLASVMSPQQQQQRKTA